MKPEILVVPEKKMMGHSKEMSLIDNKTFELFSGFMPKRNMLTNTIGQEIYEITVYNDSYFKSFIPSNSFQKWVTVEVSDFDSSPSGMEKLVLTEGLYAVFLYKGLPQGFGELMNYIMTSWLPESNYYLDNRPHFNVLGKKYKPNNPTSEEEVYIPIKTKE